jgi:hypothetical protein
MSRRPTSTQITGRFGGPSTTSGSGIGEKTIAGPQPCWRATEATLSREKQTNGHAAIRLAYPDAPATGLRFEHILQYRLDIRGIGAIQASNCVRDKHPIQIELEIEDGAGRTATIATAPKDAGQAAMALRPTVLLHGSRTGSRSVLPGCLPGSVHSRWSSQPAQKALS